MRKKNFFIIITKKQILLSVLILLVVVGVLILGVMYFSRDTAMYHPLPTNNTGVKGRVAIIIDDFGNSGDGTKEMLAIPRPLTCAVIPFLPYTKEDATLAHEGGHEVIIHVPMEPHVGNPKWLGEKGITTMLSTEEIKNIIREAIEEVPYAVGINNHMGSKVTEDKRIISAIIEILKEKNMYIVDSKTSTNSIVRQTAEEYKIPILERNVFLDNEKNVESIKKQIKILGELAIKHGTAIAIGHVGPEGGKVTAEAIKEMIPILEEMGVEIVPASKLFDIN
ncbi:MAG: divergent polysaccharide deacetylase family protein [Clostridiaceae bacterium]|nr:divergent polysaccharide deacetylase family protein [Clostridiaceae bacterium]